MPGGPACECVLDPLGTSATDELSGLSARMSTSQGKQSELRMLPQPG